MPRKDAHQSKREKAELYVLKFPHATAVDIAKMADVSVNTVDRARAKLAKQGMIQKGRHGAVPPKADPQTPEVEKVVTDRDTGTLTDERALYILNNLAEQGYRDKNLGLAKDAIKEYKRLEAQTTETTLGPPDPVTDRDKIERTTQILDVVGPVLTASAVIKAFCLQEDRTQFEEEFTRQSVTHPPRNEPRVELSGNPSSPNTPHDKTTENQVNPPKIEGPPEDTPNSPPSNNIGEENGLILGGNPPRQEQDGGGDPHKLGS
jgi:DNA-binding transcriptional regulator YhcF (GntR family)